VPANSPRPPDDHTPTVEELDAALVVDAIIPSETAPAPTALAQSEAVAFSTGQQQKRAEKIRWHTHYATVLVFWFGVAAALVLFVTWIYHLVTPGRFHYLSTDERFELQTIVLSVVGSSFVTAMAKRWTKTLDDDPRRAQPDHDR
jgi:hypothetical protein